MEQVIASILNALIQANPKKYIPDGKPDYKTIIDEFASICKAFNYEFPKQVKRPWYNPKIEE